MASLNPDGYYKFAALYLAETYAIATIFKLDLKKRHGTASKKSNLPDNGVQYVKKKNQDYSTPEGHNQFHLTITSKCLFIMCVNKHCDSVRFLGKHSVKGYSLFWSIPKMDLTQYMPTIALHMISVNNFTLSLLYNKARWFERCKNGMNLSSYYISYSPLQTPIMIKSAFPLFVVVLENHDEREWSIEAFGPIQCHRGDLNWSHLPPAHQDVYELNFAIRSTLTNAGMYMCNSYVGIWKVSQKWATH